MSTGHGEGLPDFSGRGGTPHPQDENGYGAQGGYGAEPGDMAGSAGYASDPYGQSASDPYGAAQPVTDPYAPAPHAAGGQASDPYALDRYGATPQQSAPSAADPLATGPEFADSFADWSPEFGGTPLHTSVPGYRPTSNAALTSFVLALVGIFMCCGLTSPVGLIFAFKGMSETAPGSPTAGRGYAVAGLVLSILGTLYLVGGVLYIVLMILLGASGY